MKSFMTSKTQDSKRKKKKVNENRKKERKKQRQKKERIIFVGKEGEGDENINN